MATDWANFSASTQRLYEREARGQRVMKKQLSDMIFGTNRTTIRLSLQNGVHLESLRRVSSQRTFMIPVNIQGSILSRAINAPQ